MLCDALLMGDLEKTLLSCSLTPWRVLSLWSTVPSTGGLLCQRAELHMEMKNFSLAVQDASSLCRMKPFWTKVRAVLHLDCLDFCIQALFSLMFNIQLHVLGSLFKSHGVEESRPK